MINEHYKSALLKGIQREWDALMAAVEQLTPEQMISPDAGGWSPKDNLAHLTEWLKALTGYHMDHKPAEEVFGIPKELAENFDYNRVNAYMVERNRDRVTEDVIGELKQKYADVMTRLQAMPFEDLLQPRFLDDPQKRPLIEWVMGNTVDHFKEHRLSIEKIL
jgi:hypothetical protein